MNPASASFMHHALHLARRGLGDTAENPAVGCVIVRDGQVVGRGATGSGGRPHAETIALAQAGAGADGSDVYVTLEPCVHHGQTPPCTEALIAARPARVLVAMPDPDPKVDGGGIAALEAAGIAVEVGLCAPEAAFLNQGFVHRQTIGRPLLAAKVACSQDGRIALANRQSQWITSVEARRRGHGLRAGFDCLLSGVGTVCADDPAFTCRLPGLEYRLPRRAICDPRLRIPLDAELVCNADDHPLTVFCTPEGESSPKAGRLCDKGVEVVAVEEADGGLSLEAVLRHLADLGVNRVLMEAGPRLLAAAIAGHLLDRAFLFRGNSLLGADAIPAVGTLGLESLAEAPRLLRIAEESLGSNRLETFLLQYPGSR